MIRDIVIFRALQLGDMLCAVPALRALRRGYPDAHIALIGLPWSQSFVDRYAHLIDELIVFPGAMGFPEQHETDEHLQAFCNAMRDRRFDLAIQLHGSGGVANDIVERMGARSNAGFVQPMERRDGVFIPWPEKLNEIERYTALMSALGIDAQDTALEIPLSPADIGERDMLIRAHAIDTERLVLVHAGAQLPSRRWPVERFAQVAQALSNDGCQVALTGSATESQLVASLAHCMTSKAIDLTGATTLGGLAALVQTARLVVCNDTGLSHVAAAMQTPSVVIASGSDTTRWAPLDHTLHRVLADYPACRPCSFRDCPYGHPCALNVSVEQVLNAIESLLETSHVD